MNLDAIQFIPHAKPMVFIDTLVTLGDNFALSNLLIRPELMFCDEQGLPTWASIEVMAQTISMFAGAKGKEMGHAPQIGYLLGTRKLSLPFAYFEYGKMLTIRVEQQYLHEGLGQFFCEIQYENHSITAILNVYEAPVTAHPSLGI